MTMHRTITILTASVFALASATAFAVDNPPVNTTPDTPTATKAAKDAQALKYQDAMDNATQDPQGRNIGITKSAADAKAANAKKEAAMAKMTPEQKAAAKKARDAETLKYENTMEKATQNPQAKNDAINKSAADSKAGSTPRHGTMNTPEADKVLKEQKGQ
jgi:hypothetical protein